MHCILYVVNTFATVTVSVDALDMCVCYLCILFFCRCTLSYCTSVYAFSVKIGAFAIGALSVEALPVGAFAAGSSFTFIALTDDAFTFGEFDAFGAYTVYMVHSLL